MYCTVSAAQSYFNEVQGQESDAVPLPVPAQLQPGLHYNKMSPNVSKTEVCKMLTATNRKYLSNYTSFIYLNIILRNLY